MELDLEPTIAPSNEQSFLIFCQKEKNFMVADGYWDCEDRVLKLRDKAAELFGKYSKSKSEVFDPYIPYLAMTYFDRYISQTDLEDCQFTEEDELVLFCVACLSVAWKFRNRFFCFKNFTVRNRICLDLEAYILEAESNLMKGLQWHLRSITPFMYVSYLAKSFAVGKGFNLQLVNEMIIKAQGDVGFSKYVPSVIAASAILTCCKLTFRQEFDCCRKRFLAANYFKENGLEGSFGRMYSVFAKKNVFPEKLNWTPFEDAGHVGTRSENFNAPFTNDLNWVLVEEAERVESALSGLQLSLSQIQMSILTDLARSQCTRVLKKDLDQKITGFWWKVWRECTRVLKDLGQKIIGFWWKMWREWIQPCQGQLLLQPSLSQTPNPVLTAVSTSCKTYEILTQ